MRKRIFDRGYIVEVQALNENVELGRYCSEYDARFDFERMKDDMSRGIRTLDEQFREIETLSEVHPNGRHWIIRGNAWHCLMTYDPDDYFPEDWND